VPFGKGAAVHLSLAVGPAAIATARAEASIGDVIVDVNLPSAATPLVFTERESVGDAAQPPSVAREPNWQSLDEIQIQLRNLAASDISILIVGETGSGKEHLAKNIYESSGRSKKPFQAINGATLTSERISAELFGYRNGAFTGADRDEPGLLRRADGGTVLLDELGELPADCWGSLLRSLQEGEIHPLGCPTERVDVRVLAATNKPERLPKDVQYRFDHQVEVPPLRSRRNEIAELANSFFEDAKMKFSRNSLRFGTDERIRLASDSYDWPGNVRQLKAAVRKAVLLHGAGRDVLDRSTYRTRSMAITIARFGDGAAATKGGSPLLVTALEAAALCGRSLRCWRTWDSAGRIPRPVRIGRSTLWRAEELRRWVESGCPRRAEWETQQ
jgi:DNA-binding NtrC family response regulator